MFAKLFLALLIAVIATCGVSAQQPKAVKPNLKLPEGVKPEDLADPKEAARVADLLEKEYPKPQSEAVRMLIAILRGLQMDGSNGWFDPAVSRYTWAWLLERNGLDPKATAIPKDKFRGEAALFDRLDRNGDGQITPSDLDWSDQSPYVQQAGVINRVFRRMDANGDGRLTREELDAFFKMVAKGKDYFTADDLRQAIIPRGPSGLAPGDGPSVPVLVKGFFASEIGSLCDGPKLGEKAPNFTLKTPDGKETITLSKLIGSKPVVIILGNFTCGPFRAFYPDLEAIHQRYKNDATFLMVYVREAHPSDGWIMESNTRMGVKVAQPKTFDERVKVCDQFCQKLKPAMPVVVDEIEDLAGNLYSGMPGRYYVIDPHGKVAYKSGRGPFGFKTGELDQAVAMSLLEIGTEKSPKPGR